ncbi:hypothetical protein [Thalassotalea litorea]|uniref:hypothetical protein n=1 Tax=Thalassotalea litorea TaxID=2020715 RepID=UPI003735CD7C
MKLFRLVILSLCIGYCYANLVMAFDLPVTKQLEHWLAGQMDKQQIPWKLFSGVIGAAIIPFICAYMYARTHKWLVTMLSIIIAVHCIGNRHKTLWDYQGIVAFFEPLTANTINLTTAIYLLLIIVWPLIFMGLIQRIDSAVN